MAEQSQTERVRIERLGGQGDGIVARDGQEFYVPYALPGEMVEIAGKGARRKLLEIIEPAASRMEPFCPHFGRCGGCQVQHLEKDAYKEWKTGQLSEALSREGIEAELEPLVTFERDNRRRAVLTAKSNGEKTALGFSRRGSNELVDIRHCPILVAPLNVALDGVREFLPLFAKVRGEVRISLLAAENGIDIAFDHDGKSPVGIVRAITTHKASADFIRLSLNGETILERQRPLLTAGLAAVSPPPGAFVQASASAEEVMAGLVGNHLAKCKRVADLFSGFGPFALRLAQNSVVHAAESDEPALAALDRAWRETGGKLKALTHEKRDLFRRPMMLKELKAFDGLVFDPPRAGAEAQAREIAKSTVRKVAAVSCNPVTLARDAKLLIDGGFRIVSVTPVDQFAFTPHLETVMLLER